MLTKDLLRYHISGKRIKPDLVDTADPFLLHFAERLLALYEGSISLRRGELEELARSEVNVHRDLKLARGLLKELDERSEYLPAGETPFPERRAELFSASAERIRSGTLPEKMEDLRQGIFAEELKKFPRGEIYGDLPENECLLRVKKTFPKELLERYNMDLVRSLLLYSSRLEVTAEEGDVQELRRVFKYLKFFRLLCKASTLPGKKKGEAAKFHFVIDGPASVLDNSVKYGLLLASFFPAVCRLRNWEILSEITLREGRAFLLKLDHASGLVCHFENMGAYIPEEIRLFADHFRENNGEWILAERSAFRKLPGGENVFADFSFRNSSSGRIFDLEIFHSWHKSRIRERLESVEKGELPDYLLAVEKSGVKNDPLLLEKLSSSPFVLLFSRYPGVENVCKFLNSAAEKSFCPKKRSSSAGN